VLVLAVLLWATGTQASGVDAFQVLLQHTGLPRAVHPPAGEALTPQGAQGLWRGLVDRPATLNSFAPRTVLAHLVREASASAQPLPYAELQARTARFRPLVVVRPDGYVATALTGKPLAHLGRLTLAGGELYAQGMRVGAFYWDSGGVFFSVDEALQRQAGPPVGELPLGRDVATAALLGAEDALVEVVKGLAALVTEPVRTVEGLAQLPSAVAGLIASSPEYFARYGAMNLEDQVREAARLATHMLTLYGGAATAGPRLSAVARVPVLGVSVQGALVMREVALPAGAVTGVVGAVGATGVLMAQDGPSGPGSGAQGSWPPPAEGPGEWMQPKPKETLSEAAQRYQTQVTGTPEGWAYGIQGTGGPVKYDGFRKGVLLEAKGPGYRDLLKKMYGQPWFEGIEEMLHQADRQRKAARGIPLHWHFAEREVADLVRELFEKRNITGIKVFFTPAQT
jgi:hypothetical protein